MSDQRIPPKRFAKAFRPLPGSTPVPLADLERNCCKWPVAEQPTLFCGMESTTGRYCAVHERMSGVRLEALA